MGRVRQLFNFVHNRILETEGRTEEVGPPFWCHFLSCPAGLLIRDFAQRQIQEQLKLERFVLPPLQSRHVDHKAVSDVTFQNTLIRFRHLINADHFNLG